MLRIVLELSCKDLGPDMGAGPHVEIVPEYFQHLRMLLVEGFVLGDFVDWSLVWNRLDSPILEPRSREYLFLIVNNIVPNRERLFEKMHMVASPNCLVCGVREDNTHLFTECVSVRKLGVG